MNSTEMMETDRYHREKAMHDYCEDARYRMEGNLQKNLQTAVGVMGMSKEEAQELWEDKDKGFAWLNGEE